MKLTSKLFDGRIKAHDVLFDFTVGEYLDAVRNVVENNEFQRRRVSGSKSIYSLLRQDILLGCVIPPLVLALSNAPLAVTENTDFEELVRQNSNSLIILDGLQRTYTLLDLESEAQRQGEPELSRLRSMLLRIEVYVGLNKLGILYRMLTLNTGQTPMSMRQQIEMLYSDFYRTGVPGVTFIREVDESYATAFKELNFKETVEGFTSYLERDELPLERSELLENFKNLQNLAQENSSTDLFRDFVLAWISFLGAVDTLCNGAILSKESADEVDISWGKTSTQVFKRAQVITGFGAALGKLKDLSLVKELSVANSLSDRLTLGGASGEEFLLTINSSLEWMKNNTKKIGNAQRAYFLFFFRELYNPEGESFLSLVGSGLTALHRVKTQIV
jgi:hypothetical protein